MSISASKRDQQLKAQLEAPLETAEMPLVLRSLDNVNRVFVKFVNRTLHDVVLYWIDYQGRAVNYGTLRYNESLDIDTFVTHPWIFVDRDTHDRYVVDNEDVFFPKPMSRCARARRYVCITLPMFTLRRLSLRAIRQRLTHKRQALQLDIPRCLQQELASMLPGDEQEPEDSVNSPAPIPLTPDLFLRMEED
ncbi:unnamed protein product [Xylocopa violacea]|uniref:von Hippel-Lindau disease tumour suppressor beta domain-containing protein n=1 Tax=Xylocopa violacea TaxID=135666 RepID=A0ABP1PHY0_XYLVO